ncbi:hypothetical protein TNCV_340431 [Trichonephila clavipes]|nr:hypothetical protein TNCV_340431 [Trichonephila clavipes]
MDLKCIVPFRHGGTLNSRRAPSPLVRLVEGDERWKLLSTPRCPALKLGWKRTKSNCHLYGAQSHTIRGLLATDHVILNPGQVTWTTPELAPPLLTTTPMGGRFSSRQS